MHCAHPHGISKAASLACVGILLSLATWLAFEYRAQIALEADCRALQSELDRRTALASSDALSRRSKGSNSIGSQSDEGLRELLRLRGEVGLLRQETKDLPSVRAENQRTRVALQSNQGPRTPDDQKAIATADYWPRGSWSFKGFALPDATLQSFVWAADNGNLNTLLAATTGEAQQVITASFDGKSETEASIRAMDEVMGIKSVRILGREAQSADTVLLTAIFEDRTEAHTGKMVVKRMGNDWKIAAILR